MKCFVLLICILPRRFIFDVLYVQLFLNATTLCYAPVIASSRPVNVDG